MQEKLFVVEEREKSGRGLYARLPTGVACGRVLLQELPYAFIVLHKVKDIVCTVCLSKVSDPDLCCDVCLQVSFCSEDCKEKFQDVHAKECPALEEVELIAKKASVDVDALRFLIRILCVPREFTTIKDVYFKEETGNDVVLRASYCPEVQQMVYSTTAINQDCTYVMRGCIEKIYDLLPTETHVEVDEALRHLARVNENSHSLTSMSDPLRVSGVGLFPFASLVNHSCAPNTTWSNLINGKLVLKAIRDIDCGEEITVSYIPTHQPRWMRRQILQDTKHFRCECERCSTPIENSIDRFIDGVICRKGHQLFNSNSDPTLFECHECGTKFSGEVVGKTRREALSCLVECEQLIAGQKWEAASALLQPMLAKIDFDKYKMLTATNDSIFFHPSHYVVIKLLSLLADCHKTQRLYHKASDCLISLISRIESTHENNPLALADVYYELGESIQQQLKLNLANSPDSNQPCAAIPSTKPLHQIMLESFHRCHNLRAKCLAVHHPLLCATSAYEMMPFN